MLNYILFTVFLILLSVIWYRNIYWRPANYPPGPSWLPVISSFYLSKLSKNLGGQHLAITKLSQKYTSDVIGLKLVNEYYVTVSSYATVKTVLTSSEYEGRPRNFFFRIRSLETGKGITGTEGKLWKDQRSFLVSHLRALGFGKDRAEEMVKIEIREMIQKIENNMNSVNLPTLLAPSALNILWQLTSGKNVIDNQHVEKLLDLLKLRAGAFDMAGGLLNMYPWLRHLAPEWSGFNLLKKINSGIKEFIVQAIEDHKKTFANENEDSDDFIYVFLKEMKENDGKETFFTDDQLIMVCLDIFLAGATTTSNTINFAFLAMIFYPDIQEKVYQCLSEQFNTNQEISYEDRTLVPYVEAVLLECQRYFTVVPVIGPRRVMKTTTLANYTIPENTTILINLHAVHNDKEYWKDPENFRPERFIDQEGNLTGQDRILTFGLGRRRCLGDALAKSCIFLFFVNVLRKFKIEAASDMNKWESISGINVTPGSYLARFSLRS